MSPAPGLIERAEVDTTDAELARTMLDEAYGSSLRLTGALGRAAFSRTDARDFAVDTVRLDAELDYDCDPLSYLLVLEGRSGWSEYTRQGVTDVAVPGDLLLVSGKDEPYSGRSDRLAIRGVNVAWHVLDAAARDVRGDQWSGSPRFTSYRPVNKAAARHWRQLADYLERFLADGDAVSPLALRSFARMLAHSALITFPNDVVSITAVEESQDRRDAVSMVVRRAVAFLESSAEPDVHLAEIAASAYVTPRALQIAFRRHLGTTPMAYARRVRLDRARRDLLMSAGDGETVTTVASRWGFHNLGRFAADYRAAYAEYPSETLER